MVGKGSGLPLTHLVNRAPLLTPWAAIVAEVLGFEHDEALPGASGGRA